MGKPTGFLEYTRLEAPKRPVEQRIKDWREIELALEEERLREQAARCMECGIPFCHACGCPLENLIPDWNDMVYRGQWRQALDMLHATNNFPEFTGRVCPAPCEPACTLSINQPPVSIRQLEKEIVEYGWRQNWIQPELPSALSGFKCAVVGSGPAGLAAAQQLTRAGHEVTLYERANRIGGILRYGIPEFKLEKSILDRRLNQMRAEGTRFEVNTSIGTDISITYLRRSYDAVILAGGAVVPRNLPVPGRELKGIYFAMDFLIAQNRRSAGDPLPPGKDISAADRQVLIIGGGDTGADCVGTAIRQGAAGINQVEIMPRPPDTRDPSTPWPQWPYQLRTSSSHEEGGTRQWSIMTKEFLADTEGRVKGARVVDVVWREKSENGDKPFTEVPGSERILKADLVLLAMGFTREGNAGILQEFGLAVESDHTPKIDHNFMSDKSGVFIAGDLSRGASLVVHAIADGRRVAAGVDRWLTGETQETESFNKF